MRMTNTQQAGRAGNGCCEVDPVQIYSRIQTKLWANDRPDGAVRVGITAGRGGGLLWITSERGGGWRRKGREKW